MTRLPPPLVTAIGLAAILATARLFPNLAMESLQGITAPIIFCVLGVLLLIWSGVTFRRHQTTVNPLSPERASTLVTSGPFKFSRNPMYLAMVLFLWAGFVWAGNWAGLGIVLAVVIYFDIVQIRAEEIALTEKFGDDFTDYCARVRKWI